MDNKATANKTKDQKMPTQIHGYKVSRLLGSGTFGNVYLVLKDGKEYALKQINANDQEASDLIVQYIQSQIKAMQQLNHQNIVKMYESIKNEKDKIFYIVMQLCTGNLNEHICKKYLENKQQYAFSEEEAYKIMKQIVSGANQWISKNMAHRDLKPANILQSNGQYKIADFGFARPSKQANNMFNSCIGTMLYMSPQILNKKEYSNKCDIWSLGCIFYQLIFGVHPFYTNITKNQQAKIGSNLDKRLVLKQISNCNIRNRVMNLKQKISQRTICLLQGMLTFDQNCRLSWQTIYNQFVTLSFQNCPSPRKRIFEQFSLGNVIQYIKLELNKQSQYYYRMEFSYLNLQMRCKIIETTLENFFPEYQNQLIPFMQIVLNN